MPLDPQAQSLVDAVAAVGAPPISALSAHEGAAAARAGMHVVATNMGPGPELAKVENLAIPGPVGEIPARVYVPDGTGPLPATLFFHGGGWVAGDLDTHDAVCRHLAKESDCVVLAVDYRLAPEHTYPAAIDDAYAATAWVAENADSLGVARDRLAVCGDSAGGNLAAATAIRARDSGGPAIAFQGLIYPVTDDDFERESYVSNAQGYVLTRDSMKWFWELYVPNASDRKNPLAAPMKVESVEGLPPALVLTAEYDPLRDEGEAFGERLSAAGIPSRVTRYDGMIHGFIRYTKIVDRALEAVHEMAAALKMELKA